MIRPIKGGFGSRIKKVVEQVVRCGDRVTAKILGPVDTWDRHGLVLNGGYGGAITNALDIETVGPGICQMKSIGNRTSDLKEIRAKILVVDDDVRIHEVFQEILAAEGYEVLFAASGKKGMDIIKAEGNDLDVVIIDVKIEEKLTGIKVLSEVKNLNPEAAVVIITAYSTEETAIQALHEDADIYLKKPLDFENLVVQINMLLENQALRRKLRVQELRQAEMESAFRVLRTFADCFSQIMPGIFSITDCYVRFNLPELKDKLPGEDYRVLENILNTIWSSSQRAIEVIKNVQAYLAPVDQLILEPVDISEVLGETLAKLEACAVKVTFAEAVDLPRIKMALTYFLESAIKAASEKENGSIKVQVKKEKAGVKIIIEDNGERHEELTLDILREPPFVRGITFLYEEYLRLSLGLKYIEAHGGSCEIESDKKSGTTISFWFPAKT